MMKLRCFSDEKLLEILKDACLKESIFWTERKFYPESEDLVTSAERDEMMAYLLEVCERTDMGFSIETFSLTVTLVDRFLASFKVKSKYFECLAVSCLYIAAKVREEDEKISITSEFLMDCNSKCSVSELLRMELMILTKFEWSVDDITAADFLYIFHALLVNKYIAFNESNKPSLVKNKWKVVKTDSLSKGTVDSAFPPSKLDFLHSLEYKLKQLLCTHELATLFRSRVIAFALLSTEVDKVCSHEEKSVSAQMMMSAMQTLKQHAKITDEHLNACKEKVTVYLAAIDADKTLLDSYMDKYYSEMARNHRANSRLSITLSAIANHLTAIKEEDETEEQEMPEHRVLATISNQLKQQPLSASIGYHMNMASNFCNSDDKSTKSFHFMANDNIGSASAITYADKVMGFRDQKRKLSENSSTDEEFDYDCENRN